MKKILLILLSIASIQCYSQGGRFPFQVTPHPTLTSSTYTEDWNDLADNSNPTSDANWDAGVNTMQVNNPSSNGSVHGTVSAQTSFIIYNGTFGLSHYSEAVIDETSGAGYAGVGVNLSSDDSGYGMTFVCNDGACYITEVVDGVEADLDSDATGISNDDVLRVEVDGDDYTFYINDVLQTWAGSSGTITNTDIPSGGKSGAACYGNSSSNRTGDWEGGTL